MKIIRFHTNETRLRREAWAFVYFDTEHRLVLQEYVIEARVSVRHKFRPVEVYERQASRGGQYDGIARIAGDDVPLEHEVVSQAKALFLQDLMVTRRLRAGEKL